MNRTIGIILTVTLLAVMVFTGTVSADSETTPSVWSGEVAASYEGGLGTKDDPYQIATAEQMALLSSTGGVAGGFYKLTADIYLNDVSKANWTVEAKKWFSGDIRFKGHFDGNGHTVYGLYYSGDGITGLFPREDSLYNNVSVSNLKISEAHLSTSSAYVGGIIGFAHKSSTNTLSFENCVIDKSVTIESSNSGAYVGGLVGYAQKHDKGISVISSSSLASLSGKNAGAFFGIADSTTFNVTNSFVANKMLGKGTATINSSYESVAADTIVGDAAMTVMPDLGWDATWFAVDGAYPENIAFHKVSLETPWNGTVAKNYAGGSGTEDDPYQIATAEQLALLVNDDSDGKYYKLTSDIYLNDVSSDDWTASAQNWDDTQQRFKGSFDGDGHTIYGLYYNGSTNYAGLFCFVQSNKIPVEIKNIRLSKVSITTSGDYAGAFAGFEYNNGTGYTYTNCIVDDSVSVEAKNYAGGFIGYSRNTNTITSCASLATVTAAKTGGMIGYKSEVLNLSDSFTTSSSFIGSGSPNSYSAIYSKVDASAIKGAAAKTVMPGLSWNTVWVPAEGLVPQHGAFYVGDYASGTGTATDPYILTDAYHLYRAIYIDRGANTDGSKAYYKLASDLYLNTDESAVNWYNAKAEKNGFIGSIEGDGFTVYGLIYGDDASACGGLIPLATKTAEVKNLRVEGADVNTERGGAIIGWANDEVTVSGCSVSGATVTADWAGAIVGLASAGDNIVIKDSYAVDSDLTSTSTSSPYSPALYGDAYAVTLKLENCYIEGYYVKPIKADGGVRAGTVTNCYFTATEDTVLPATDTSGIEIKDGNWSVISGFSSDIWYQAGSKAPLLKVRGLRLMDVSGDDNSVIDADDYSALRLYIIGDAAYKNIIGDTDNNGMIDVCDLVKLYL